MSDRYAGQFTFSYSELLVGVVRVVHPVDPQDRRLRVDVRALNGRGTWSKVPIAATPGVARNYRRGQIVVLGFRHTGSNFPVVIGNLANSEGDPDYADPLAPPLELVGDQVYYHPETGAYMRFRDNGSPPGRGFGAPPNAGRFELAMSSGASIVLEEPAGSSPTQCALTVTMPSGATLEIDVDGNVTAHSPHKVVLDAPDVELGGDTSQADGDRLARKSDVESLRAAVNAAMDVYNGHTHTGKVPPPTDAPETHATEPPYSSTSFSK